MTIVINLLLFCFMVFIPFSAQAAGECRVLVVMSYESDYPWTMQQKEGIDSVLASVCDLKYFYLNTKRDFDKGLQRAREAFETYLSYKPHGVIAADDDAQAMFVVPYLNGKTSVPVMFCGVNADPGKYGYPSTNVSGVLERHHIAESIVLVRQLIPSIKSVGFIMKDSPVAYMVKEQVRQEFQSYSVKIAGFVVPKTLNEAINMARDFRKTADVLYIETLEGIQDDSGRPVKDVEAIPLIGKAFGKGTITGNSYYVEYGLLAAVVITGQDQGATASHMLRQAMSGTPVTDIHMVRNHNGKRMINVSVMKELKINPKPQVLRGVELVRTRKQ